MEVLKNVSVTQKQSETKAISAPNSYCLLKQDIANQ